MSSDDELPLALLSLARGQQAKRAGASKAKKTAKDQKGGRPNHKENMTSKTAEKEASKKPRVTYDRPGQTRPTPPESDPLRRYYTSLYRQQPDSALAQRFCAQHGLMPLEEAERWAAEHGKGGQSSQRSSQPSQSPKKLPVKKKAGKTAKKPNKGPSRVKNDGIQVDDDSSGDEYEP